MHRLKSLTQDSRKMTQTLLKIYIHHYCFKI